MKIKIVDMDVASFVKAIKAGANIVSALKGKIESIEKEMQTLHLNIGLSHLNAARSTISAFNYTNNQEATLREIITHLKAAFFVYESAINEVVKYKVAFLFPEERPFLDYSKKLFAYKKQLEIGSYVATIYGELHEMSNKEDWKNKLKDVSISYVNARYNGISAHNIMRWNDDVTKNFISKNEEEILKYSKENFDTYYEFRDSGGTYSSPSWDTKLAGDDYLKSAKQKQLLIVLDSFKDI